MSFATLLGGAARHAAATVAGRRSFSTRSARIDTQRPVNRGNRQSVVGGLEPLEPRTLFGAQQPFSAPVCLCETDVSASDNNSGAKQNTQTGGSGNGAPPTAPPKSVPPGTIRPGVAHDGLTLNDTQGGNPGAASFSAAGVQYATGEINLGSTDVASNAAGSYWGINRTWSNVHDNSGSGEDGSVLDGDGGTTYSIGGETLGTGWFTAETPTLFYNYKGNYVVAGTALDARAFHETDVDGTQTFASMVDGTDSLQAYADRDIYGSGNGWVYSDASGNQEIFDGYGRMIAFEDASGEVTHVEYNIDNELLDEYRDVTVGGHTVRDEFQVTGVEDGSGGNVTAEVEELITDPGTATASTEIVRQASYTYYGEPAVGVTPDPTTDESLYDSTASPAESDDDATPYPTTGGPVGSLRSATIADAAGNTISSDYYVYYVGSVPGDEGRDSTAPVTDDSGMVGYNGAMKFEFSGASYARLMASVSTGTSFDSLTDAQLAPYADLSLQYNSSHAVSQVKVQGQGCSVCGGGIGTYSYTYADNGYYDDYSIYSAAQPDFNAWKHETVETLPDGNENIVYSNYYEEPVLKVYEDTSTGQQWRTAIRYDGSGRVIMEAQPSAVSNTFSLPDAATLAPSDATAIADGTAYPTAVTNLLGYNATTGDYTDIYNSQGEVALSSYYGDAANPVTGDESSFTEGNDTLAGGAGGYLAEMWVQEGDGGGTADATTPVPQLSVTYYTHSYTDSYTGATIVTHPEASQTQYRNSNGTGAETTNYSYTFESDGTGPGIATITQVDPTGATEEFVYDQYGYQTWTKDADGALTYTQYDPVTGGIVKEVQDADPSAITDPTAPAPTRGYTGGPTLPAALNLTSTAVLDDLGRTTEMTDPNGNVTYVVYNDAAHEERVYNGWNATTGTATGPTEVYRDYWPTAGSAVGVAVTSSSQYSEGLTTSAAPSKTGSAGSYVPTGQEAISTSNLQSLSRILVNAAGQQIETDQYASFTGVTYSQSSTHLGTAQSASNPSGNYDATLYAYDDRGRQSRVETADGTIARTYYDGLGGVISVYVGTDDSTTNGWTYEPGPSGNGSATSNMVLTSSYVYDGGGIGDGDLTESVNYPAGPSGTGALAAHATLLYYDWRDRPVAEKDGVPINTDGSENLAAENDGTNRPITYLTYDNLDEATQTDTYTGDGVAVTSTGGVPNAPAAGLLVARSTTAYDDLGRVYQQSSYSVDPTTATVGAAETTKTYYDPAGNVIEQVTPTGLTTWTSYDGADRPTDVYAGSAGSSTTVTTPQIVLSQVHTVYDADGNVIETITADRLPTDSATATGALGNAAGTGGPAARVSYVANYYDAADRETATINVGTNGGSAWTRPSTVPNHSATALVTNYTYDAAGRVGTVIDPGNAINTSGGVTAYTYDALGQTLTTVTDYTGTGAPTDSTNQTTTYAYDGDGHVTQMTAVTPEGDQVTNYAYGVSSTNGSAIADNDLLYAILYPDPTTGQAIMGPTYTQRETYAYDALGEATSYTDRDGTSHTYAHDALGRLSSDTVTTFGTGVDTSVKKLGYAYNGLGLLATATSYDAFGVVVNQTSDTYDGLGQLATEAQSVSGAVVATGTGATPTVGYTYDTANGDRLTGIIYPNGRALTYSYGVAGSLTSAASQVTSISDSSGPLQSYTYLGLDTPVTFTDGNGTELSYVSSTGVTGDAGDVVTGLDRFGRVVDQKWTNTSGATVDGEQYAYDQDSNVLARRNEVIANQSESYTYDGLNRLATFTKGTLAAGATAIGGTATESWSLDALGNWTSTAVNGVTASTRTNSDQNQVKTVTTPTGSGANTTATLGYDANGNTTTDNTGQQYVYDAWNRLVKVTEVIELHIDGATVPTTLTKNQYTYDAQGRRVTDLSTHFYYSDNWQVLEARQDGATTEQDVWSPFYVDRLVERDTPQSAPSDGSPDASFGESGENYNVLPQGSLLLTTGLQGGPPGDPGAHAPEEASAVGPDGKLVVAVIASFSNQSTPDTVYVYRYNADGSLDTTFGTGGVVGGFTQSSSVALAIQPDGKILLTVSVYTLPVETSAVVRLNVDGSIDTTYGTDGQASLPSTLVARSLALQPDGKLLVGGTFAFAGDFVVVRLDADGSPDDTFGTGGTADVPIPGVTDLYGTQLSTLLLRPDGDIVAVGASTTTDAALTVVQLTPTGQLDGTFGDVDDGASQGSDGIVTTLTADEAYGTVTAALQADGKLLVAIGNWTYGNGDYDDEVYRFTATGDVDPTFGAGGHVNLEDLGAQLTPIGIATTADGQILVGGTLNFTDSAIARLNADGSLDPTFGTGGIADDGYAAAVSMAMTADGRTDLVEIPGGWYEFDYTNMSNLSSFDVEQLNTQPRTGGRLYAEQDADYNVTSLTNAAGAVVERYAYDPYGAVTVENPDGTVRGDGTAASSSYGWTVLHQGLRLDVVTGTYDDRNRVYIGSLGRFAQEDPYRYIDSPNMYQYVQSEPISSTDPSGLRDNLHGGPRPTPPQGPSNPTTKPTSKPTTCPTAKRGLFFQANPNSGFDGNPVQLNVGDHSKPIGVIVIQVDANNNPILDSSGNEIGIPGVPVGTTGNTIKIHFDPTVCMVGIPTRHGKVAKETNPNGLLIIYLTGKGVGQTPVWIDGGPGTFSGPPIIVTVNPRPPSTGPSGGPPSTGPTGAPPSRSVTGATN
jgi:RHS repeat-associated protein/uncharacterized delta-60 repeat protein